MIIKCTIAANDKSIYWLYDSDMLMCLYVDLYFSRAFPHDGETRFLLYFYFFFKLESLFILFMFFKGKQNKK